MAQNTTPGVAMARAIRRFRGAYLLSGKTRAEIRDRWYRFRRDNTRKQRYLYLVVFSIR